MFVAQQVSKTIAAWSWTTRIQKDGIVTDIPPSGFLNPGIVEGEMCGVIRLDETAHTGRSAARGINRSVNVTLYTCMKLCIHECTSMCCT